MMQDSGWEKQFLTPMFNTCSGYWKDLSGGDGLASACRKMAVRVAGTLARNSSLITVVQLSCI